MTEPKPKRQRDAKGRLLPGHTASLVHGASHYMVTDKLPSMRGRRALNKYLKSLDVDLVASTGEMNVKKELLIKQVVRAEGVMRLIELYLQKAGIMKPGELKRGRLDLQNCLSASYIAFMNVQRQALLALGLEAKPKGELSLADIVAEIDREAAERASQGETGAGADVEGGDADPEGGDEAEEGGQGEGHE